MTLPLGSLFQTEARVVKCFSISKELAADRDPLFRQSQAPGLGNAQCSGHSGRVYPPAPPQGDVEVLGFFLNR